MKVSGTKEWAVATINCSLGCPHNCRYCFARYDAVVRFNQVSESAWTEGVVDQEMVDQVQPLFAGQVMFPSRHDITPENIDSCLIVLEKLIDVGNQVLIVTKPHLDCIKKICDRLQPFSDQILFRFTITAANDRILKFWEPGAPSFNERKQSLEYAYSCGFTTSVSVEPMLDVNHIEEMISDLEMFVTHSIWLGKMNKVDRRVVCDSHEVAKEIERIKKSQTDKQIIKLYNRLKDHPILRWKESIKQVVGLELARMPGLDI